MKLRIFASAVLISAISSTAWAANCPSASWYYESCKPGYYLSGGNCIACPAAAGVTTVDKNTGGITSCYTSTGGTDSTGTFEYTGNCYYSN